MKNVTKAPAAAAANNEPPEAVDIPLNEPQDVPASATQAVLDSHTAQGSSGPVEVTQLDPGTIYPGPGPNRLEEAFESEGFGNLADSILRVGGNVQPIVVRPLLQREIPAGSRYQYLLVSGARRLRACLQNRLNVLAIVRETPVSPHELIDRLLENHLRESLSAIEFGWQLLYIREQKPEISKRALARYLGCDDSLVVKALDVAELPRAVINCFASPAAIRYSDAKPLKDAFKSAPEAVLAAAEEIRMGGPLKAAEVVRRLTEAAASTAPPKSGRKGGAESFSTPLEVDGQQLGEVKHDKAGRPVITLDVTLNDAQRQALNRQLQRFLREKILGLKPSKKAKAVVQQATAGAQPVSDDAGKAARGGEA